MSLRDWFVIEAPLAEEITSLAGIPGVQFTSRSGRVERIKLHRSTWPLAGLIVHGHNGDINSGTVDVPEVAKKHLRDYQRSDIPWLLSRRASILGYEMRLGKTATACAAHDRNAGPLLIVGPLIARDVWSHWIERVHGFKPVCLESKTDIALPGFPAYFCHFDILDSHSGFLQTIKPATFIIDEIHMLQARRSLRMSTCSLIAASADRIIGLSGTPMWSNPGSMWPILNLLAPSAWGTEFEFKQRYMRASRGAWGWMYNGTNNESEFTARLSEVVKRRTWKEVAPSLPPTINVVEPVEINSKQRHDLELAAERARLASGKAESYTSVVAHTATLRQKYGMLKVKRAVELGAQAIKDGHKVVLWTWHTEVADKLFECMYDGIPGSRLQEARRITAEQSQDTRASHIAAFQSSTIPTCLIVPLAVGGVAIDLSASDLNIFVELDWIPATNYQASMRVFKPGRPHSNVFLFVDVPVERRLMEVLGANEGCQSAMGLGYEEIAAKVLG